ncbi:phosphoglycerate mutase (2,3-diphosphoglycerate-independent) [Candidatus Falkowbacteria bacterium RIFOXYD2_FULL_35_9]|uniref:2,3-bisphosphoglycerate-independent phosphoglycerate mutase n=1 Tax=Candidatus Falkowbacteria bacterium RIFOXYC2_FULL_36_12 TaxID=1798002 RepID=A0A1F5SZL1_9BACT|nr:MAG: phosphoglycerate mutase (2,3-diphosphoglycerate-independent) [Candidatus Falkowbacteria bacterium RIFOXYC2_FULL_36_12]OGF32001.1 MAG: phosphoglycerate mutase (2,3-diphosphoglycerate-independent) [Candidatus Falkowbacteria bacterium RIFOXYB2_FULL_35_7]OGF34044.1 MAG: phosphoglycerate mutase (2,3-diphosphoglycerate-independent) [Candidatus Falkowbacteria bacterium RIFOXYA2_FULL_35_8]OGF45940.1 MAG: phosphoglycerate mutase (2,3-diphosphoglycerate-independent) [Candidatus Falkowbacteria bact
MHKPIVLLILDGWGIAPKSRGNAIVKAKTSNFDKLIKQYPHSQLCASGSCVGLPEHQPGNSESGHLNIGAGRIVLQDASVIDRSISDKTFFSNTSFLHVLDHLNAYKSQLHFMGLICDGTSPHSSLKHLYALIEFARLNKIKKVYLHLFTDGRDSPQRSIEKIIKSVKAQIKKLDKGYNGVEIVTLAGRFYTMDRGKNWDRTKVAYDCLVGSKCQRFTSVDQAIKHSYNAGYTDEYLEPAIISEDGDYKQTRISDNDAIIFFNLRSDRARQIAKTFAQRDFNKKNPGSFKRSKVPKNVLFCALTDFGPDLSNNIVTAFQGDDLIGTLPFVMNTYKQLYIAETEKFAHVTYFMNGGHADPVFAEDRVMIPSPVVQSYAEKPEMSVYKITDYIIKSLKHKKHDFIVANFANADMLGHTGDFNATVEGVSHVDICIGKIMSELISRSGTLFLTADHGNAETMLTQNNEFNVQHTSNPVPFIVANHDKNLKLTSGNLGDIAPTIYDYFDIAKPEYLSGQSLITRKK